MRDPGSGDEEFLGSIGAGSAGQGGPRRTTAGGGLRRPAPLGEDPRIGQDLRRGQRLRIGGARAMALLVRGLRDGAAMARSPWFWGAGAAVAAAYLVAVGPAVSWLSGAGGQEEPAAVSAVLPVVRLWALPAGLGAWALVACAGPLPPGRRFAARYAARLLGRVMPLAVLAALAGAVLGSSGGVPPATVAASAATAALSTGLCGALGASVRAAVVRPGPAWTAAALLAVWVGGGCVAATAVLLPATSARTPRYFAANVERDGLGRLVGFECTDYRLADHESLHPEAVAWLAAPSPAIAQIAASEGTLPADSPAGYAPVLLDAAAVGPAAWEPCLEGSGPQSVRPVIGLGPLGTLQLAAGAAGLAVLGARRRPRRADSGAPGVTAGRRAPGSGAGPSQGGPAASP